MSGETQKVDVLAVLDGRVNRLECDGAYVAAAEMRRARAAVAELIHKADTLATAMSNLIAARQVDDGYAQYVTDVTAAIARIGGAA